MSGSRGLPLLIILGGLIIFMQLTGVFPVWEEFMRLMINSLALLYKWLFNNFGLSIIVFTVVVRLAMFPLTRVQTRQMRAMSKLQPAVKKLQEKYKGKDKATRAKMSQEQMALYKNAGVSPIGCLGPMFIQMPIWFALYRSIFRAMPPTPEGMADLSGFLYIWNPARSQVPLDSGFLGMDLVDYVQSAPPPINILMPVLVGASMWVTQKMTATTSADPRQQSTQRMMLWMMPIMFGFFTFQFPTGLALYILFSNLIGIVIQYFVNGRRITVDEPVPELEPALTTPKSDIGGMEGSELMREVETHADSKVHGQNRRRGRRSRTRNTQSKTRRSRNRRR